MVAWQTDHGAYWISNTLLQTLSAKEMLGSRVRSRGALVKVFAMRPIWCEHV